MAIYDFWIKVFDTMYNSCMCTAIMFFICNENSCYTIKTYCSRSESFGIMEGLNGCVSFKNKLRNIFLETCKKMGESHISNDESY